MLGRSVRKTVPASSWFSIPANWLCRESCAKRLFKHVGTTFGCPSKRNQSTLQTHFVAYSPPWTDKILHHSETRVETVGLHSDNRKVVKPFATNDPREFPVGARGAVDLTGARQRQAELRQRDPRAAEFFVFLLRPEKSERPEWDPSGTRKMGERGTRGIHCWLCGCLKLNRYLILDGKRIHRRGLKLSGVRKFQRQDLNKHLKKGEEGLSGRAFGVKQKVWGGETC